MVGRPADCSTETDPHDLARLRCSNPAAGISAGTSARGRLWRCRAHPPDRPCSRGRRRQRRRLRGHLPRAADHADAGRTAPGRGHEPYRSALDHGDVAGWDSAWSFGARRAAARSAARALSQDPRAEGHARRHLAVRHPAVAFAHRDGDRSQAGAKGWRSGAEHLAHRRRRAVRLRLRARPVHAGIAAAASRPAFPHIAVPRDRALDFIHQDRGGDRARDGFHPPQSRADHRRLGDLRRLRSAGSSLRSRSASRKQAASIS